MWDEDGTLIGRIDDKHLELDGVKYHRIDIAKMPQGFASLLVEVDDNGTKYKARLVAGLLGIQATSSGWKTNSGRDHAWNEDHKPAEGMEKPRLDSLQPATGWIMYEVKE